jgi:hypothetical protein
MVCEASASGSRRWFNSCGYGRGPTTDPARRRGRLNHSYRRFCRSGGCMGSGHRRARHRGDRWAAHLSDVESHSFARFAVRRASTSYPLQLGQNLLRVPVQHRPTGSVHWPFMTRRGSETRGVKREVDDVELPGRFRPLLWIGSMRAGAGNCPRSLIFSMTQRLSIAARVDASGAGPSWRRYCQVGLAIRSAVPGGSKTCHEGTRDGFIRPFRFRCGSIRDDEQALARLHLFASKRLSTETETQLF